MLNVSCTCGIGGEGVTNNQNCVPALKKLPRQRVKLVSAIISTERGGPRSGNRLILQVRKTSSERLGDLPEGTQLV